MNNLKEIFWSIYKEKYQDIEAVIVQLRELGMDQFEIVRLLISELKMSLKEADALVVNSKAWKDFKKSTEDFREQFGDTLEHFNNGE